MPVKFESALNEYPEVHVIRLAVMLMCMRVEHSLPKATLSRLKTKVYSRNEWADCIHISDLDSSSVG